MNKKPLQRLRLTTTGVTVTQAGQISSEKKSQFITIIAKIIARNVLQKASPVRSVSGNDSSPQGNLAGLRSAAATTQAAGIEPLQPLKRAEDTADTLRELPLTSARYPKSPADEL